MENLTHGGQAGVEAPACPAAFQSFIGVMGWARVLPPAPLP
jgi:hypothetical protein